MAQLLEDIYIIKVQHEEVDKLEWIPFKNKASK